jgi:hypothetical protein
MTTEAQPLSRLLLALTGPILWALHFFIVYGLEAVVCARAHSPIATMQWIVAIATTAAVAGTAAFLAWRFRHRSTEADVGSFLREIAIVLALISIGAILVVAASTFQSSPCFGSV